MIRKGKITTWNDGKGFGFITESISGKEIFVHIKAFKKQSRRPEVNRLVTYIESTDRQGRICAAEVTLSAAAIIEKIDSKKCDSSVLLGVAFLIFLAMCGVFGRFSFFAIVFYVAMSFLTYIVYSDDKDASQKGDQRTPEKFLHLLSLLGGWPGAILAQQKLRHKTIKESFRIKFWFTVFLNLVTFFLLTTPSIINADKFNF